VTPINWDAPPVKPICRSSEDPDGPCQFVGICNEVRQTLHSTQRPPIRGKMCWAFLQLVDRLGTEEQAERAAIQGEDHGTR